MNPVSRKKVKRSAGAIEECRKRYSSQIRELAVAYDLFEQVCNYIDVAENELDVSAQKRLITLTDPRARRIWKRVNAFLESNDVSTETENDLWQLLVWIDSSSHRLKLTDKRNFKDQVRAIKEIGKIANTLLTKITGSEQGYVTAFLNSWAQSESRTELPMKEFTGGISKSLRGPMAWHRQKVILERPYPLDELIVRLTSIKHASQQYDATSKPLPDSQIGLKSRKKAQANITYLIVQLHLDLERIFGKPEYSLNADVASIALDQPISKSRVEEIVYNARKRGEIPPPKIN